MMTVLRPARFLVLGLAVLLAGCAHGITIAPNLNNLPRITGAAPIQKKVGYFIAEADRGKTVTTPAGGGDKVSYPLYANLEPGFYRTLSNVFAGVSVLKDPKDARYLSDNAIAIVFTPQFTSNSSSRNAFFWPPTDFSVTINCTASDPQGRTIWETSVTGTNDLTSVSTVIHDFGVTGRSAAESALQKLQTALEQAAELR
jgi:hypothetical protein